MFIHRISCVRLLAGSVFTCLPLSAAVADTSDAPPIMEPIVVTATLGPRTVGESLSSVTIIDEEDIRRQSPTEFKDLLRGQPGINVVTNGSFGKNTSVYTRGTANDSTIFLVDGVRLRSATSGGAPWQYFPVELVDRVEIVRGPRSSLYGADAVGGVIQAFTHEPGTGDHRGWVEAGGGSFDTRKGSGGISARAGNTRFSISGLHKESDGTAIVEEGDDMGFRNSAGVGRIVHELDSGGEASLVMMQSEGNTEYQGGNIDFLVRTLGLRLDMPVTQAWHNSIQFSESRDEMDDNSESYGISAFTTRTRSARWVNTFTAGTHELVAGAELLTDEVEGTTNYAETSRTNTAIFSQLRLNFGRTDAQLSLRADDNEAYGKNETGNVALGYAFDRRHRIRLSYGTAFRAPTFNDLYYPISGNDDLEAEQSETVELGLSGNYQQWFWDVALYQLNVEDLISWEPENGLYTPRNVDEARIRGLELAAGIDVSGWRANAAMTLSDPRNRESGNRLERRSTKSLRLDLDKQVSNWSVGGSLVANGHRYEDPGNDIRLPGYATLDLRTGWRFAPDWSARLNVTNVLDKQYSTAQYDSESGRNYIAAGRTAMLTVRYDIQ